MKKLFALLLCAAMVLAMAACGAEPAPTDSVEPSATTGEPAEVSITDGIYEETTIGMKTFYRFNEDGTYYGWFFEGGVSEAGTYEIVDKEIDYREEGHEEGETAPVKTAPQIIITTSYQGAVTEIPYAEDTLMDVTIGGMAGYRFMHHNAEYEYIPENEEMPLVVYTYYANNESGSTLTLYHDLTFVDYTGEIGVEGTWKKTADNTFTLTDENGVVTDLVIDGSNATYGEVALRDKIIVEGEAVVITTYRVDETEVGLPMPVALRLDCYSDGSVQLVMEIAAIGAEVPVDAGTHSVDGATFYTTFAFDTLGAVDAAVDYENASVEGIPATVTIKGDIEFEMDGTVTPLSIDAVLAGMITANSIPTPPEVTVLSVFDAPDIAVGLPMNVDFHIACLSDGSCTAYITSPFFPAEMPEVILDYGTYTVDEAYGINFVFAGAGEVRGEPDYATATADGLTVNIAYKVTIPAAEDGSSGEFNIDTTASGQAVVLG